MATDLRRAGVKTIIVLLLARGIFGAAQLATFTVVSILIVELGGNNASWTGVPSLFSRLGAAAIAMPIGLLMARVGRRIGLTLGYTVGIVGLGIAGLAAVVGSLPMLLAGVFLVGMTQGVADLARYAAGEANPQEMRGRAISYVVMGGTIGSLLGPVLVDSASKFSLSMGYGEYSGPLFAGAGMYVIATLLLFFFLRPDPMSIARQLAEASDAEADRQEEQRAPREPAQPARTVRQLLADARVRAAVGAMIFGQVAMVTVMTITPIHMKGHAHSIGATSLVIMFHTIGMFGLSWLTGWLVDAVGRVPVIVSGSVILVVACLMAPFNTSVAWLGVALFLLGYGWNLTFVGGSTLLDDLLLPHEKASMQGTFDTMVSVASALGGFGSGLIYAQIGFDWTSWGTMLLGASPVLLVLAMWAYLRAQQAAEAPAS